MTQRRMKKFRLNSHESQIKKLAFGVCFYFIIPDVQYNSDTTSVMSYIISSYQYTLWANVERLLVSDWLLSDIDIFVIVFCHAANFTHQKIKLALWIICKTSLLCLFGFQVKEKETARKEYKQAIEKGHGAYLMDQDAPVCPLSALILTHIIRLIQALSLGISKTEILDWSISVPKYFNFHLSH